MTVGGSASWVSVLTTLTVASLGWIALLMGCAACTAPPDVVAAHAGASVGGEGTSGDEAGGGAAGDGGDDAALLPLVGALDGHDPSALFDGDKLWIVSGAEAVLVRTTTDLVNVEEATRIFDEPPSWVVDRVPGAQGIWSPELAYFGGIYHLYYAVSTIASNRSCIGHATTDLLDVASEWLDGGPVICTQASDDFNAIDPSILQTPDGQVWLAFGSYASGIKLVQLDAAGARTVSDPLSLAARPDDGGALQAAALAQHGEFYYLFVSFGAEASHRLMVGRATELHGPYVDRTGRAMLEGGGAPLFEPSPRFVGAGSNDIFRIGQRSYNIFHAYDEEDEGRAKLRLASLTWDSEGWPVSGGP
jgi:arabinan endo-1,5-alpha-L-arabinosidase